MPPQRRQRGHDGRPWRAAPATPPRPAASRTPPTATCRSPPRSAAPAVVHPAGRDRRAVSDRDPATGPLDRTGQRDVVEDLGASTASNPPDRASARRRTSRNWPFAATSEGRPIARPTPNGREVTTTTDCSGCTSRSGGRPRRAGAARAQQVQRPAAARRRPRPRARGSSTTSASTNTSTRPRAAAASCAQALGFPGAPGAAAARAARAAGGRRRRRRAGQRLPHGARRRRCRRCTRRRGPVSPGRRAGLGEKRPHGRRDAVGLVTRRHQHHTVRSPAPGRSAVAATPAG